MVRVNCRWIRCNRWLTDPVEQLLLGELSGGQGPLANVVQSALDEGSYRFVGVQLEDGVDVQLPHLGRVKLNQGLFIILAARSATSTSGQSVYRGSKKNSWLWNQGQIIESNTSWSNFRWLKNTFEAEECCEKMYLIRCFSFRDGPLRSFSRWFLATASHVISSWPKSFFISLRS